MLLSAIAPIIFAFFCVVSALPSDTNGDRIRQGLPIKPPATRARRQVASPSQVPANSVNGLFQIARRAPSARRNLMAREAPSNGFMAYDGSAFRWTETSAEAAIIRFPSDTGRQQPLQVYTGDGLAYLSLYNTASGIYELRATPEHDGTSLFTWTSVTSREGGSNVGARAGSMGISFRLDENNDRLVGSTVYASTSAQNPVWLFVNEGPVAVGEDSRDAEVQKMIAATNNYRRQYGADPLTYNTTIEAFAQSVADKCVFEHSGGGPGRYGENLIYGGYSLDSEDAVNAWGPEEAVSYDFDAPGFSKATGHFTQLVWKATTEFGCAYKLCPPRTLYTGQNSEAMFIVCNYHVFGNNINPGQFERNVGPKVA